MKAVRLGHDRVSFDFTNNGDRVRGTVTIEALVALLNGEVDTDANLAPGAAPTTIADFLDQHYVPFSVKQRLTNENSLSAEQDLVKTIRDKLGARFLHDLRAPDMEECKIFWLEQGVAHNSIRRRLGCLRRTMEYAVLRGMIKANPLPAAKGLSPTNRSHIWLKTPEIDKLLDNCDPVIRPLVAFMVLTGARVNEARDLRNGDISGNKLKVPTEKRHGAARRFMRTFDIPSLGPRFQALLTDLRPHHKSGFYFVADQATGEPISYSYFHRRFKEARDKAGLSHIHPHDLRGGFCAHRSVIVRSFRQLQIELGHRDARSIQSYLDLTQEFDPTMSIFYVPPANEDATKTSTPIPTINGDSEAREDFNHPASRLIH
jgi:integrase